MPKSIVVVVPHNLGAEAAKKRIAERIDVLRSSYVDKLGYSEINWTGDRADLRVVVFGQTVTGQIDVMPDSPAHRGAAAVDSRGARRQDPRES